MADLAERVGFHLEGVVATVRAVRGEPTPGSGRDGPRLLIGQWAPGLVLHFGRAEFLHVGDTTSFSAATEMPLRDDESRSMRTLVPVASAGLGGVVHAVRHLREVNRVGVADPEFRRGAIGHDVRRLAASVMIPDLGLGAHRLAQTVDMIEELDHAHQRVASVPGLQLVRRAPKKV